MFRQPKFRTECFLSTLCQNSQFELRRNLPQNHTQLALWRGQVLPGAFVLRVDVSSIVLHPSNAPGLGVAVVCDIVYMALESPERRLSFIVNAELFRHCV
jgi:hypothetical protein